jgi:hypothetical protein
MKIGVCEGEYCVHFKTKILRTNIIFILNKWQEQFNDHGWRKNKSSTNFVSQNV